MCLKHLNSGFICYGSHPTHTNIILYGNSRDEHWGHMLLLGGCTASVFYILLVGV